MIVLAAPADVTLAFDFPILGSRCAVRKVRFRDEARTAARTLIGAVPLADDRHDLVCAADVRLRLPFEAINVRALISMISAASCRPVQWTSRSAYASADGLCPHADMLDAITNAVVVVANYYHAFDPLTKEALTAPILDGQTLVVCDEAHMLVPRVRELLGDSLSRWSLNRARNEILSEITEQSNAGVKSTMQWAALSS